MSIGTIGVIGAGTMGAGIAQIAAAAGLRVLLVDVSDAAVERGVGTVRHNFECMVATSEMTETEKAAALGLIQGTMAYDALQTADVVIESATENFGVKRQILEQVDRVVKAQAIVASN
jgi:3-hydroxybutyryl-CoA dehydrogenase